MFGKIVNSGCMTRMARRAFQSVFVIEQWNIFFSTLTTQLGKLRHYVLITNKVMDLNQL